MAHIATSSVAIIFVQVIILVLDLSPTVNCVSLDNRTQLKQLEDYVRI